MSTLDENPRRIYEEAIEEWATNTFRILPVAVEEQDQGWEIQNDC